MNRARHQDILMGAIGFLFLGLAGTMLAGCGQGHDLPSEAIPMTEKSDGTGSKEAATRGAAEAGAATKPAADKKDGKLQVATFGAGCFWCVEAVLDQVDGVVEVTSGYMGGTVANPTYEQVCGKNTGHAEVVQVTFDPARISYSELLDWFWQLHDPTTLNQQGNDVGTQYRSVIFVNSDEQRKFAEASKKAVGESGEFDGPIVTEIAAAGTFYPAENYHQDYYEQNKSQGYCRYVIAPKLRKLGLKD